MSTHAGLECDADSLTLTLRVADTSYIEFLAWLQLGALLTAGVQWNCFDDVSEVSFHMFALRRINTFSLFASQHHCTFVSPAQLKSSTSPRMETYGWQSSQQKLPISTISFRTFMWISGTIRRHKTILLLRGNWIRWPALMKKAGAVLIKMTTRCL